MNKELHKILEEVNDETSFLIFVDALCKNRQIAVIEQQKDDCFYNHHGWENDTIESFLEAAKAWAIDSKFGTNQGLSDSSPWKKCAAFLYSGKIYE